LALRWRAPKWSQPALRTRHHAKRGSPMGVYAAPRSYRAAASWVAPQEHLDPVGGGQEGHEGPGGRGGAPGRAHQLAHRARLQGRGLEISQDDLRLWAEGRDLDGRGGGSQAPLGREPHGGVLRAEEALQDLLRLLAAARRRQASGPPQPPLLGPEVGAVQGALQGLDAPAARQRAELERRHDGPERVDLVQPGGVGVAGQDGLGLAQLPRGPDPGHDRGVVRLPDLRGEARDVALHLGPRPEELQPLEARVDRERAGQRLYLTQDGLRILQGARVGEAAGPDQGQDLPRAVHGVEQPADPRPALGRGEAIRLQGPPQREVHQRGHHQQGDPRPQGDQAAVDPAGEEAGQTSSPTAAWMAIHPRPRRPITRVAR
jgi:hypothetical protein